MRHYNFKLFEESDPDLIRWLDSLPPKERSAELRKALRAFKRGEISPRIRPSGPVVLNEVDESLLDQEPTEIIPPDNEATIKENLEKLKDMF